MSDNDYIEHSRTAAVRAWVLGHMMRGAAWAALVFFGVIVFVLLLRAASWLLPTDPNAGLVPETTITRALI